MSTAAVSCLSRPAVSTAARAVDPDFAERRHAPVLINFSTLIEMHNVFEV